MIITNNQNLVLGGPGCGKTTFLINILKQSLNNGVLPEKTGFVSFTKKAVTEAVDRCGLDKKNIPYFRTLHSLAFSGLGLTKDKIINNSHLREISRCTNIKILGKQIKFQEDLEEVPEGDKILFILSLAKLHKEDLYKFVLNKKINISWSKIEKLSTFYSSYKEENELYDFTDILVEYNKVAQPLPLSLAIIDEAQDLSLLQWDLCKKLFSDVKTIYIAGDDDQAIYDWAGADIRTFLSLEGNKIVLDRSHRLPKTVFNLSQNIVKKITSRYEKDYIPRYTEGVIKQHSGLSSVDFRNGSWLILSRNQCFLKPVEDFLQQKGIIYDTRLGSSVKPELVKVIKAYETLRRGKVLSSQLCNLILSYTVLNKRLKEGEYTFFDLGIDKEKPWYNALLKIPPKTRDYFIRILKNGYRLEDTPRIHLSTIHASKGGESEKVLVITDVTKSSSVANDDLHRVFFVAVTRAKEELHILSPQTRNFYLINKNVV